MTAAVPLIHAVSVAGVTGIIVQQTGESEGSGWREWEEGTAGKKSLEMKDKGSRLDLTRGGRSWKSRPRNEI